MSIQEILSSKIIESIKIVYNQSVLANQIAFQKTKQEFEGDITLLVFPLTKTSKKSPEETANRIGEYLKDNVSEVRDFNVVKGFLNLVIQDSYWINYLQSGITISHSPHLVSETILVEFSSPNTNKPLHLGHVRNNLLGSSIANILKASGRNVIRVNLINDRGVHICKSMLAWKKWGNGETPISSGMKGDHLVGKYYVEFDKQLKAQGGQGEEALKNSPLMMEVQEMLRKWEAGDTETIDLWKKMNGWVYDGFAQTYRELGIEFEKTYFESQTYLLGKKIIDEGLSKGVFKKKEDNSVWIDLTHDGLDEKLLLRSDGTSVYITQDLGTIIQRSHEYKFNRHVYVVGSEQEYHFKVLFLILKKLGYEWADKLYHLSYGMVDLPSGKMKSREGTVVDGDELMTEMIKTAGATTRELGKTEGLSDEDCDKLFRAIGLGALKYFILKIDPKKKMLFNPQESIDFNGNTGPFIQYTYARIKSVLRKAKFDGLQQKMVINNLQPKEKALIKLLHEFDKVISESADSYNPGHVANYVYELAKEYNQFYHECPILKAEKEEEKYFRLILSEETSKIIYKALTLLGIEAPERM